MSAFGFAAGIYGVSQPVPQPGIAVRRPLSEADRQGEGQSAGAVPPVQTEQPAVALKPPEAGDQNTNRLRDNPRQENPDAGAQTSPQPPAPVPAETTYTGLAAKLAALHSPQNAPEPVIPRPIHQDSAIFLAHQFGQERGTAEAPRNEPLVRRRGIEAYAAANTNVSGYVRAGETLDTSDAEGILQARQTTATVLDLAA
ncbi:MAG: hypothetical protein ABT940_09515 [Alphaproteobacteria bacterium]